MATVKSKATTTRKPTKKAAASKAKATKTVSDAAAPAEVAKQPSLVMVPNNKVKRSEFVARVAERSGLRPNQVKPVLEAVLEELSQILLNGEELKHPSLGKLSVNRRKELAAADVVHCKLRRQKPQAADAPTDGPAATAAE